MKFTEIPGDRFETRLKLIDAVQKLDADGAFPALAIGLSTTVADSFKIRTTGGLHHYQTVNESDHLTLSRFLTQHPSFLAEIRDFAPDGTCTVEICGFAHRTCEMGSVSIGVDENGISSLKRIGEKTRHPNEWQLLSLTQKFCFKQGETVFFFAKAASPNDPVPADDESSTESARPRCFWAIGDGVRFLAKETMRADGSRIIMMSNMTKYTGGGDDDRALQLVKGCLRFEEWTKAEEVRLELSAQMSDLIKDVSGYLNRWMGFNDYEGELLLRDAREVGHMFFTDATQVKDKDGVTEVRIAQANAKALERLTDGKVDEVECVDELPDYLLDESMRFSDMLGKMIRQEQPVDLVDEYDRERIEDERARRKEAREKMLSQKGGAADRSFKVLRFNPETHVLRLKTGEVTFPSKGTLVMSTAGALTQFRRRGIAKNYVLEGKAANPELGLIIEEKGQLSERKPSAKQPSLSAFVEHEFFYGKATQCQKDALYAALNTPDIALIQGPPGTGKTTVIAAILARLGELSDGKRKIKGTILLSGFQHDAVENMTARMGKINSVPVPKFGGRSDEKDEGNSYEKELRKWCEDVADKIAERNPSIVRAEHEKTVSDIYVQYSKSPTRKWAMHLMQAISDLGPGIVDADVLREVNEQLSKLTVEDRINDESANVLTSLYNLRVSEPGFMDDGPERAYEFLEEWRDMLSDDEITMLEQASDWSGANPPTFLPELQGLKKRLLSQSTRPPAFAVEQHNEKVLSLARQAIDSIRHRGMTVKDEKSVALMSFLRELRGNPKGMEEAVAEYSSAFAATCQQSVGKDMLRRKGLYGPEAKGKLPSYEYVIVDEAARVGPLDLLISMAQGARILLVGDHRQLPQLVDETKIAQMEQERPPDQEELDRLEDVSDKEWYKSSMFQYLFTQRIPQLEAMDGFSRCVTLDTQYRMHPRLGQFISDNFYKRFNPKEAFKSGLSAENFSQNLEGTLGRPAMWLEVPKDEDPAVRFGTSWVRPREQVVIKEWLTKWMESPEGKELSFGVISFYKAQTDELADALRGKFSEEMKPGGRLRVGTVDSFQGMEFDVVFLSVVRTAPSPKAAHPFGHLVLYNRLNVAMSRQKRLLVVVGDPGIVKDPRANDPDPEIGIPGLVDFYKLCKEEGVVRSWH